jgi:uracil-DNA glycosylase
LGADGLEVDQMDENLSLLNCQLRDLYERHWGSLRKVLQPHWNSDKQISFPLLLKAHEAYEKASRKLVIVGQQTSGWDNSGQPLGDDPIGKLMQEYQNFALGRWYRPTPFYQASYVLQMSLNPSGPAFGFLWTNLVKVDRQGLRPETETENLVCEKFPVVAEEISILSPDAIIFFTGPYYDDRLEKTFSGLKKTSIDADTGYVQRLEHKMLPALSFRTYHPGYLARSPIYGKVMRTLAACLDR